MKRESQILKTSIIGIVVNMLLTAVKAFIGIVSGSIAISLDAVNNLKDALSSVITIAGIKLALKPADKSHPYGYGRIEHLSSLLISGIIIAAGINFFITSVKSIFNPYPTTYTAISLSIIAIAIVVKGILGKYTLSSGQKTSSQSLIASGREALFDVLISCATLISAGTSILWHIYFDGILGTLIAAAIIFSGGQMLLETVNSILGQRVDSSLSKKIKADIASEKGVVGVYDLVLHNYGPEKVMGSVHIELYDNLTVNEAYKITKAVQRSIMEKYDILLTVGIYSVNTKSDETTLIKKDIYSLVLKHDGIISMHALYIDMASKEITFDIVIDLAYKNKYQLKESIEKAVKNKYPSYSVDIVMDTDFSD